MVAKPLALPGNDGTRLHECQGGFPARLEAGEPHPEEAIAQTEPRAMDRLLVDGSLMPQGQVFQA